MTSSDPIELNDDDHSITGVSLTTDDDGFVVHCPCGWASKPHPRTRDSVAEWQRHRDRV